MDGKIREGAMAAGPLALGVTHELHIHCMWSVLLRSSSVDEKK